MLTSVKSQCLYQGHPERYCLATPEYFADPAYDRLIMVYTTTRSLVHLAFLGDWGLPPGSLRRTVVRDPARSYAVTRRRFARRGGH